ncbi:phospho-2-dehydro-3-deoxyheptonate aldolase [Microtetraspora sp. NBRC 13810]|uniref:3-deoxy-7-phosphoheptulonate synthase n=1 Tax=Microtetraspora sp. NBRC 13810 TaxID=3030990 RepID=UPI0024A2E568|nr:3-deoxy-7-phosphoheptulonate synthase [Microtetraspora sp. NBRC 13810]GLW09395.1 phospho-2-dehydro-3-deoxyheptonate aldolase [Microtetraspora sp. NBRC 13810]
MEDELLKIRSRPAAQQPEWGDAPLLTTVHRRLRNSPGLVCGDDVSRLRSVLARVAAGQALVVLAGDCSEDPAECTAASVARKVGLLDLLAGTLKMITGKPVVRAGRIAGQFAKPRSRPTERRGDVTLPVYRGHMVNSPDPDPLRRRPDPLRILAGYRAAAEAMSQLGWLGDRTGFDIDPPVWTAHEALLLDYELPMLRRDAHGQHLLASTHWPWIGDRTRDVDGAHVSLLSMVINPVACKIGPGVTTGELLELCRRLDPGRVPGRLTLVARMGPEAVADRLPPLVAAVRGAGHPVIWLTDPLHANTVTTPSGLKTRYVDTVVREVQRFQIAVTSAGGVAGGLHLETTPDEVTECVANSSDDDRVTDKYTTFCDPRLNPSQAVSVISAWTW